jgi:hypothetical protein
MRGRAIAIACALVACAPRGTPTPAPKPKATLATPLAAVLAAGVCPELEGRLFALASGEDGVTDTFVIVKRCTARAEGAAVGVVAVAYAWVAVDRDLGAFGVHAFVHATVRGDVRAETHARYEADRLEVTLTFRPPPKIAVEPVGVLDLAALNWASFLVLELAPAAGASPEALAKTKVREEAERTLVSALATPIVVLYDGRNGATSLRAAPVRSAGTRVRVVPHGMALAGPFPPTSAASARLRVEAGRRVAVSAVCRTHAERILDADRRGDSVSTDDWIVADDEVRPALGAMPCTWMLAVRAKDETAAVVGLDVTAPASAQRGDGPDRWVSIDEVSFDAPRPEDGTVVVVANDVWRRTVFPLADGTLPAVVVLAPDEHISLRAQRNENGKVTTIAEARLHLDKTGDASASIVLRTSDGRPAANVRVRTRVRQTQAPP